MIEFVEFLKDALKYIILIVIIILIRIFVLTGSQVIGDSMNPTLSNGNLLLVDQLTGKIFGYKRFEIIAIHNNKEFLVKRIVGLPGEKIQIFKNKLYINDILIKDNRNVMGITSDFGPFIVSKNKYFVLGDNREDSNDSRVFGTIDKSQIIGKPFLIIWPFNRLSIIK